MSGCLVVMTDPFEPGGWILVVQGCLEGICFVAGFFERVGVFILVHFLFLLGGTDGGFS